MATPKRFVIGDVHGCARTLEALLRQLPLEKGDALYFLGDYIDRGPDSKGVVDIIFGLQQEGYAVTTLRGNHEQLMLDSVSSPAKRLTWLRNGGTTALASFGARDYGELEAPYRTFFDRLDYWAETDGHVLVHAGFNFEGTDPFSDKEAMLWLRDYIVDRSRLGGPWCTAIHPLAWRRYWLKTGAPTRSTSTRAASTPAFVMAWATSLPSNSPPTATTTRPASTRWACGRGAGPLRHEGTKRHKEK
jgi:serine/threonine protein phosphatase 1